MLFRVARKSSSPTVQPTLEGSGMKALAIEEGRWVKTIVLIKPILRANGPAKTLDIAASKYEIAVTSPSVAVEGLNCRCSHKLHSAKGTMPSATLSAISRIQSLYVIRSVGVEMLANQLLIHDSSRFDGAVGGLETL